MHGNADLAGSDQSRSKAQALLDNPASALVFLRDLLQSARHSPEAEMLLAALPGLMDLAGEHLLALLADSYQRLYRSLIEPEQAAAAIRKLIDALESPQAAGLQHQPEALELYRASLYALEHSTLVAVGEARDGLKSLREVGGDPALADLRSALADLIAVAEAAYACERVASTRDRLAYLAAALERLGEIARRGRTLGAADRAVIVSVTDSWMNIVARSMGDLQTRARITCRLVNQQTWQSDPVTVALHLRNEGQSAALNLRVILTESPEYTPLDDGARLDRLASGDETQVELRLRPHLSADRQEFRARFTIVFDDPRGPNHDEQFADAVYLLPPEETFQNIPNPYVVGTPLQAGSPLFVGREDIFAFIDESLRARHRNHLTLIGQRRTGKSSLLKQLPDRLNDDFASVYIDGQSLALDSGLSAFFYNIAIEMAHALEDRGLAFTLPEWIDFEESPAHSFERDFLPRVRDAIGNRHLLLLLDEFEELEAMVQQGKLDAAIFPFLRHLLQHFEGLSVIFCGTHRMEELANPHWQALFNLTLYRHVGFLARPDTVHLIEAPVSEYGMRFDDLALDALWRVTAGHPYFLQLLCHGLVNLHNRARRSSMTISDVNAVVDEIVSSSEAHFAFLWAESTREEQLAMAVLSRRIPLTGRATVAQVADYLAHRGVMVERGALAGALRHLAVRDILASRTEEDTVAGGDAYGWRLGLLALWIEKYQSLARILEKSET